MGRPGFSSDIGLPETGSMSQAKFFYRGMMNGCLSSHVNVGLQEAGQKNNGSVRFFQNLVMLLAVGSYTFTLLLP